MDVYKGLADKKNPKTSKDSTNPVELLKGQIPASNSEWDGAPKAIKPASDKQKGFIKGLLTQKGIDRKDEKIAEKLENLTSEQASAWIDKLNKMEDKELELPEIQIEQGDMPE
jgi:hypothetical protein